MRRGGGPGAGRSFLHLVLPLPGLPEGERVSGYGLCGFCGWRGRVRGGEPVVYESSPGIRRTFCGECGTPLSYEDERLEGEVYLAVGVFDEPERFRPTVHSWDSQRLRWFHTADGLPRHRTSSRPRPTGR